MSLDAMRKKLLDKAKDAATSGRNPLEFTPDIGETKVRLLPPKDPEALFYHSHSYHYLPNDGGKYMYCKRKYAVGDATRNDPIDEAVSQWYSLGKANKNKELLDIAGTIKRKRHYYFEVILVDEPDPEKKYRILVDRSNDGKLAKKICKIMGVPFFKDVDDNWVDKTTLQIDEDSDYYDLLDTEEGHDLKIKKTSVGSNSWDISYEDSVAVKKARVLTAEEKKLLDKRVDLKNFVQYEESYEVVRAALELFISSIPSSTFNGSDEEEDADDPMKNGTVPTSRPAADEEEEEEPKKKPAKTSTSKGSGKKYSEDEVDDILKELDDDE